MGHVSSCDLQYVRSSGSGHRECDSPDALTHSTTIVQKKSPAPHIFSLPATLRQSPAAIIISGSTLICIIMSCPRIDRAAIRMLSFRASEARPGIQCQNNSCYGTESGKSQGRVILLQAQSHGCPWLFHDGFDKTS